MGFFLLSFSLLAAAPFPIIKPFAPFPDIFLLPSYFSRQPLKVSKKKDLICLRKIGRGKLAGMGWEQKQSGVLGERERERRGVSVSVWFGFVLRRRELRKVASLLLTNDVYIYIYIIGYYYPSLQRVLFYLSTPPYHFYKTNPLLFRLFTIPYSAVTPSAYPMLSPFSFLFFSFFFSFLFFIGKLK